MFSQDFKEFVELLIKNKIRSSKFVGQSKRQGDPGMSKDKYSGIFF